MSLLFCVWADQQEEEQHSSSEEEQQPSSWEEEQPPSSWEKEEENNESLIDKTESKQASENAAKDSTVVEEESEKADDFAEAAKLPEQQLASPTAVPVRPRPRIGPKSKVKRPAEDEEEAEDVSSSAAEGMSLEEYYFKIKIKSSL